MTYRLNYISYTSFCNASCFQKSVFYRPIGLKDIFYSIHMGPNKIHSAKFSADPQQQIVSKSVNFGYEAYEHDLIIAFIVCSWCKELIKA